MDDAAKQTEAETGPRNYVGMPAGIKLDEFGSLVESVFGSFPFLVGSALRTKQWRDVDVRLMLDDAEYEALGLGDPNYEHHNAKWVALVLAFSALAREMTGLPVDFQIQQRTRANLIYDGPRFPLGLVPWRMTQRSTGSQPATDAAPAPATESR